MSTAGLKPQLVTVYLGLGSNLGNRQHNLEKAVELLAKEINIIKLSPLYETDPVGYREQPRFLNAVCEAATSLSPEELLSLAKKVEVTIGRIPSFRNAPRPIDIDILFYGNEIINLPELTIPHPRLEERAFVLVPLAQIAPELVHPVTYEVVGEMARTVEGREGVKRWHEEATHV
jgi:GTP cyclohydrolase-4